MLTRICRAFYGTASRNGFRGDKPSAIHLSIKPRDLEHHSLETYLSFKYDMTPADVQKALRTRKLRVIRNGEQLFKDSDNESLDISIKSGRYLQLDAGDRIVIAPSLFGHRSMQANDDPLIVDEHLFWTEDNFVKRNVVYNDNEILVLNKPHGLELTSNVLNRTFAKRIFGNTGLMPSYSASLKPLNIIDRRASGLTIISKNIGDTRTCLLNGIALSNDPPELDAISELPPSIDAFGNILKPRIVKGAQNNALESPLRIEKTYYALLSNVPSVNRGTIENHLFIPPDANLHSHNMSIDFELANEDSESNLRFAGTVSTRAPDNMAINMRPLLKLSKTHFEVNQLFGHKGCMVILKTETNRLNQIRVHCSSKNTGLDAPILGDFNYGISSFRKLTTIGWGQLLDFSKHSGFKSFDEGMPMFLHLKEVRIKNYFTELPGSHVRGDLVLKARLPRLWHELLEYAEK